MVKINDTIDTNILNVTDSTNSDKINIGNSIEIVENNAANVLSPAAGSQKIFIDSADNTLKIKDSSSTVKSISGGLSYIPRIDATDLTKYNIDVYSSTTGQGNGTTVTWFKRTFNRKMINLQLGASAKDGGGGYSWTVYFKINGATVSSFSGNSTSLHYGNYVVPVVDVGDILTIDFYSENGCTMYNFGIFGDYVPSINKIDASTDI